MGDVAAVRAEHQNNKRAFATGLTRTAGLTGLKNPVHPVNHANPVTLAMIYHQMPI
jgi:hypothetical protein